jgi:hypothetical protein
MEIIEEQKLLSALNELLDLNVPESAFEKDSDEYFKNAKMLLEPDTCGVIVDEKILKEYHNWLEDDPDLFISFLSRNFEMSWVKFGKLIVESGY